MLSELRHTEFDLAIVAFPRFRIALLLWLARVTTRVGSGYRWYSFLFNKRVYEHRKTASRHEYEYNLSLLRELGCDVDSDITPYMSTDSEALRAAQDERRRLRLSSKDIVAILHPGSGGSARNWSAMNFGLLALRLTKLGWKVVVTGARGEGSLVREVLNYSGATAASSVGLLSLKELPAFIKSADLFVSNSTGPLHIAAAVGTPVIGFYPPIVACSPQRWGPVTEKKFVFVPDRTQCELCEGGACRDNVCMNQIKVDQVEDAAKQLVNKKGSRKSSKVSVYS